MPEPIMRLMTIERDSVKPNSRLSSVFSVKRSEAGRSSFFTNARAPSKIEVFKFSQYNNSVDTVQGIFMKME